MRPGGFEPRRALPQGSGKPCESVHDLLAGQRRIGQKLAVGPVPAPGRAAHGFRQQRVDQVEVEVVEHDPVVEQRAAHPALGVPGEFPLADGEVGRPGRDAAEGQNTGQPAEQPVMASCDVGEPRALVERQDEGDVQATRSDDDRAAARLPVQQRDTTSDAGRDMGPRLRFSAPGQYDTGMSRLPDKEALARACRGGRGAKRRRRRALPFRATDRPARRSLFQSPQSLDFEREAAAGRQQSVVLELHAVVLELHGRGPRDESRTVDGGGKDEAPRQRRATAPGFQVQSGYTVPSPERSGPVYLDCAATCPIDPCVQAELRRFAEVDFGNAGSRTHAYGRTARQAVERARAHVARVAGVRRNEVVFTSGATEANNLALLGLEAFGRTAGRTHLVSTTIEHHAVLEPLRVLAARGFELTLVDPEPGGWVDADRLSAAVRPDTLLVSVMQVNNETGVEQPIAEIADRLADSEAFLHVDAAQGFGKALDGPRHPRVDLVSISGHKICGPKGTGALITRQRNGERPPLTPLLYGGGQELGLRPGTLPVALIAACGRAAELALDEHGTRRAAATTFQERLLAGLAPLAPRVHGDPDRRLPYILNLSIPGWDKEALIEAWAGLAAISDGAACTSQSYTCSHVLAAMGLSAEEEAGAVRLSWCHLSAMPDLEAMTAALLAGAVSGTPRPS